MLLATSDYPAIFRREEVFYIAFIFDFVLLDGATEFLVESHENAFS